VGEDAPGITRELEQETAHIRNNFSETSAKPRSPLRALKAAARAKGACPEKGSFFMSEIVAEPSTQQPAGLHPAQQAFAPVIVSDAYASLANR
jgi:hypothetical protein